MQLTFVPTAHVHGRLPERGCEVCKQEKMLPATTFPPSAVHSPLECIDEVAEVEHSLRDKRHGIDAVGTPAPHLLREAEISLCSPKRGLEGRMSEAVRHEEIANYPPELEGNTNWQRAMSELGHVVPC